jgi:peptide/nickel transport system permease protein
VIYYLGRRIALVVLQLLAVLSGVFVLLRLLPADPATQQLAPYPSPAELLAARERLGLNESVGRQFWHYLVQVVHGDLGRSWASETSVWHEMVTRLPVTLEVVVPAMTLAVVVGLVLGRAAAARVDSRFDRAVLNYTLAASAQPSFFWALVMILVFFTKLHWAPAPIGLYSFSTIPPAVHTHFILIDAVIGGDWSVLGDIAAHLAVPVILLAVLIVGPIIKMTRQSVLSVVHSDYMLYARLAGLPPRRVRGYELRNGLPPVLTLTGIFFAASLGGVVIIESIFAFPGIAFYALTSAQKLDYPAVQGCVVVMTLIALTVYLLMDIAYAILDPRVAYGRNEA